MGAARFHGVGRVQGVWFRAATRERALALGLRGCARNLADGGVEVVAAGEAEALAALEAWLHVGPPLARVSAVTRDAFEGPLPPAGFETA